MAIDLVTAAPVEDLSSDAPPTSDEIAGAVPEPLTIEIGPSVADSPALASEPPQVVAEPSWPLAVEIIRQHWPLLLVALWLAGVILLPLVWLVGYVRFARRLPVSRDAEPVWLREWNELLKSGRIGRAIPLRVTDELGPMLCWLPRGHELLVPEPLWRELEPAQRRAILRHELAHFVRGDVWTSLAARVLALAHWFNPLAWYAVSRFEEAAEWACDLAATTDVPATTYAKALVRLGETCSCDPAYGPAASGHSLAARVRRVLVAEQREDSWWKKLGLVGAAILLSAVSLVRVELVAREPDVSEPAAATEPVPEDEQQTLAPVAAETKPAAASSAAEQADDVAQAIQQGTEAAAAKKMVEEAAMAYEATQAAYDAETATIEALYGWSLRWLAADEAVAVNADAKIAAAQAHVDRMHALQQRIKKLFESGFKGGEAKEMHAANYYLAEAQRKLAQLQDARKAPPTAAYRASGRTELEINIADLEGQLDAVKIDLEATRVENERRQKAKVSETELRKRGIEMQKLQTQRASLERQLNLYRQKLQAVQGASEKQTGRFMGIDFKELKNLTGTVSAKSKSMGKATQQPSAAVKKMPEAQNQSEPSSRYIPQLTTRRNDPEMDEIAEELKQRAKKNTPTPQAGKPQSAASSESVPSFVNVGTAVAAGPTQSPADEIDLEIKIAELEGQLDAAKIDIDSATASLVQASQGTRTAAESAALDRELLRAKAAQKSLERQLELYRRKLKAVQATTKPTTWRELGVLVEPGKEPTKAVPAAEAVKPERAAKPKKAQPLQVKVEPVPADAHATTDKIARHPELLGIQAKPKLLYDGKDFDQWANDLRTDLSPARRTDAVEALTAFGEQGEGRRAAEVIMDVMRGVPMQQYVMKFMMQQPYASAEAQFRREAIRALGRIPAADAIPLLVQALNADDENQRWFVVGVLYFNESLVKSVEIQQALATLLASSNVETRRTAAFVLAKTGAVTPDVFEAVRSAIESQNAADIQWALTTIYFTQQAKSFAALAPRLAMIADPEKARGPFKFNVDAPVNDVRAAVVLRSIGTAALPELEKALQTAPEGEKERLRRWHEVLQGSQNKVERK